MDNKKKLTILAYPLMILNCLNPEKQPRAFGCHSALMRNQTKLWKTKTGPLQDDKAWSKYPKSALFEILKDKEHFFYLF